MFLGGGGVGTSAAGVVVKNVSVKNITTTKTRTLVMKNISA